MKTLTKKTKRIASSSKKSKKRKPIPQKEKSSDILEAIFDRYPDDLFLKADGFDEAVIGVDEETMRLIYSVDKCIEILMKDMDYDDAVEYFEYNVRGSYMGEKTPIWSEDNFV